MLRIFVSISNYLVSAYRRSFVFSLHCIKLHICFCMFIYFVVKTTHLYRNFQIVAEADLLIL